MATLTLYTVGHSNQTLQIQPPDMFGENECSEETPELCHRRLLAEHLRQQDPDNVKIVHLV